MAHRPSRRELLKASAAAALGLATGIPAIAAGAESRPIKKSRWKNEQIQFAIIGVGGRGGAHVAGAAENGVVYALCDVDAEKRTAQSMNHPSAHTFQDFREMLDILGDRIDAVSVATPDHVHAVAAAAALRMGKPTYCEKPLTRTIGEARHLAQIARQADVPTQMGNQGTSNTELRKVAALIQNGTFGTVKEVHCWTNRSGGWWPQGVDRPEPAEEIPKKLDWNLWLGPSPERPYADGYHPFAWRGWWDFGSGSLGDIGCHCMNLPYMALDLRNPLSVQAETSGHNRDSYPSWSVVRYEFGKRGSRPALPLTWYDGGKMPPQELAPGVELDVNGCLIVCESATLYSPREYGSGTVIVGGGEIPDIEVVEATGQFDEFAEAVAGGPEPWSNFPNYSGPLAETVLLGNLAVWADGNKVEWDARNAKAKGTDAYDSLIWPEYRDGWEL